jgi:hypothetical protein
MKACAAADLLLDIVQLAARPAGLNWVINLSWEAGLLELRESFWQVC